MVGLRAALMVMALGCVSTVNAASKVTVNISGTVLGSPPCVINNDRLISVFFGDVQTADIDGRYKNITIPYSLDCSRAVTNQVRMQVKGNGTWFLPGLLAVPGNTELGISIKKDGAALAMNTWANFDGSKQPVLQAVLIKRAQNSEIKNGTFSASATLLVEYQ